MPKKVAIINGSYEYELLFTNHGWDVVANPEKANLVVFTGGEDVSPNLYNHKKHHTTWSSLDRDAYEVNLFHWLPGNIPCVGICRGAQFLNVMCGGEIYQDVSDHTRPHTIKDAVTGKGVFCTSTHHQMMKPSSEAVLVASSAIGGTRTFYSPEKDEFVTEVSELDYEVVCYPLAKVLCFQPHPEMGQGKALYGGMRAYFFECLNKYLGV